MGKGLGLYLEDELVDCDQADQHGDVGQQGEDGQYTQVSDERQQHQEGQEGKHVKSGVHGGHQDHSLIVMAVGGSPVGRLYHLAGEERRKALSDRACGYPAGEGSDRIRCVNLASYVGTYG